MSNERVMAMGRNAELKLLAQEQKLTAEEARRSLREATGPLMQVEDIDSARVMLLCAQLITALDGSDDKPGYRALRAEMAALKKEYGL